jgi:tetratricopeptide (TPR) repeat protein
VLPESIRLPVEDDESPPAAPHVAPPEPHAPHVNTAPPAQNRYGEPQRVAPAEPLVPESAQHAATGDAARQAEIANSEAAARARYVVSQRAADHVRRGFSLANRGAYYSARTEFIRALRLVSQSLDAAGGRQHGDALAAGLRALDESDDFVPRGARVEADLDLATLIPAHRTPVLKDAPLADVSLLSARQWYYTYAQQQLALAAGGERAGSMALYGMARVQTATAGTDSAAQLAATPKAMALHQAALLADSGNYMAANELGVLLARHGQWEAARALFLRSVQSQPQTATWQNLAIAHERLGEQWLAQAARQQATSLAAAEAAHAKANPTAAAGAATTAGVAWTTPADFARHSSAEAPRGQSAAKPTAQPTPLERSSVSWLPWAKSKQ